VTIKTKNLLIVPHLPRHLRALIRGVEEFENTAGLRVADGIRDQLLSASKEYFARLEGAKQIDPWQFGFAVIHKIDNILIGMGGFPGPPDEHGVAQIAYGIAPKYQGHGHATEVANALIDFASGDTRVKTIRAHTLAEPNASTRVLEKCGFVRAGESIDEGQTVWRWERSTSTPLHPSEETVRRWGEAAVAEMAKYLSGLRPRRLYPQTTSREIREKLWSDLPNEPVAFDELLDKFREIVDLSRHNAHPRMFGYVQSPGTAIAAIADLLASTLNANLTAWRSAPAPVEIERLTINWIKQILGYDASAAGLFVSGGSMANFSALAAARHCRASVSDAGVSQKRPTIYASRETHHSIWKAADLLGIGRENVRTVKTNDRCKIDIDDLVRQIESDEKPIAIVANAGTVMTGAVDPLGELADVAQRFNLWLHVDASYGGFAALAESVRPLFRGIERADSIALDPHKWLYLPVDCGCVLYRDADNARATFSADADYTRVIGQEADEAFAFWDYGPELSRRFRALKVWMMLQLVGTRALRESIENDIACARHLEQLVRQSDDFEMLAPVELSIFCFRHRPVGLTDEELDAHNEQLLVALQRDGSSYLSNAVVNGRFALRGCVMNYRTTPRDMEILLDDLRRLTRSTPY
jgi:aromatic-L-amino-acid/L-tryptophan decarboxylase